MTDRLITSLEQAGEGSRELDGAVLSACGFVLTPAPEVFDTFWRDSNGVVMTWERPTLSVDCALALAKRVLPGWEWLLRTDEERGFMLNCWRKGEEPNLGDECFPSYAPTPALALCLAILRAANPKGQPNV